MQFDHLIVGLGLAGAHLAISLQRKGRKICVADAGSISSSQVAAGLMNPVTGRRITPSWMAEEIFPFAFDTYARLEKESGEKFLYRMPVYRAFPSEGEKAIMLEKAKLEGNPFLEAVHDEFKIDGLKELRSGAYALRSGGHVDTQVLLNTIRNELLQGNLLIEAPVNYSDIKIYDDHISWDKIDAHNIIFCEGYRNIHNPWFGYLPIHPLKGELLTIEAPGLALHDKILTAGNLFIIPLHKPGTFKIGSTYQRDETDDIPTKEGRNSITDRLEKAIDVPYEVIGHTAGIRPAVRDRRPVLGRHHKHDNLYIFNGLGTKGVTLAPYMAAHLTEHLIDKAPLMKEVDVCRFGQFT